MALPPPTRVCVDEVPQAPRPAPPACPKVLLRRRSPRPPWRPSPASRPDPRRPRGAGRAGGPGREGPRRGRGNGRSGRGRGCPTLPFWVHPPTPDPRLPSPRRGRGGLEQRTSYSSCAAAPGPREWSRPAADVEVPWAPAGRGGGGSAGSRASTEARALQASERGGAPAVPRAVSVKVSK